MNCDPIQKKQNHKHMALLHSTRALTVFLLVLLLCFEPGITTAQKDSVSKESFDSVIKLNESLRINDSMLKVVQRKKNTESIKTTDSLKKAMNEAASIKCGCIPNQREKIEPMAWVLVLLPAVFLSLLLWLFTSKGLGGFDLSKAMSENTYPSVIKPNAAYTAENLARPELAKLENLSDVIPPTIEVTYMDKDADGIETVLKEPHPSVSRYIAFLTTILTLVIVLGVTCFYIYHYIRTGCPPELTGISTLLIALGIGILPYIFNKVSGSMSRKTNESI